MKHLKTLLAVSVVMLVCAFFVSCESHTHVFTDTVVNPTCTHEGYTLHSCECGYSFKDSNTDALGHELVNEKVVSEPACITKGKLLKYCSRCSHSETADIAPLGHTYTGVWELTKEPTCGQKGVESMFCQICNAAQTRSISAKEHTYSEWVKKTEPTCLETGLYVRSCTICNNTEERTTDPVGHNFSAWETTRESTCKSAGQMRRKCRNQNSPLLSV